MNKNTAVFLAIFVIALGLGVVFSARKNITPSSQTAQENFPSSMSQVAPATGEPADPRLILPDGLKMTVFSDQTPVARDLEFSPAGVLLVSLRSDGKIVALPDKNQDGQADQVIEVLTDLENPHGIAFYNGKLFVAEEAQLVRYTWDEDLLTAKFDKKLLGTSASTLPESAGRHVTRSIVFDQTGNLYLSVGSTCDTCEETTWAGSVIVTNEDGENPRTFSRGLRNAVFLARQPEANNIWVTEMSRDNLGKDLPADEINILQNNAHYGWPYCYEDRVFDQRFNRQTAEFCTSTTLPTYKLRAHSAPLGLHFIPQHRAIPAELHGDLLVAYHGAGDRSYGAGYKVARLHVDGDRITNESDFVSGFLQGRTVIGRPVDITHDYYGNLYLSDDFAGKIYLIQVTNPPATP